MAGLQGEQVWEQVGNGEVSRSQTSPGPPGEPGPEREDPRCGVCAVGPVWAEESTWLLAHYGL